MKFLEENDAYIDCANDDINTTNANGKFLSRLLMNMSQNEIEKTSERTTIFTPRPSYTKTEISKALKSINRQMDESVEEFL